MEQGLSVLYRIPPEIEEFFSKDGNYVLAVKGDAGTGKTIFSFECIREIAKPGCGIYFAARVDPESIYGQHPWIREFIPPENLVDTTKSMLAMPTGIGEALRYASVPEFLKYTYSRVEELKSQGNVMLVIDSFDALHNALKADYGDLANTIADFARRLKVKTLMVSERGDINVLDFVADGVVELRNVNVNGRIFRELVIKKLRGVEVSSPVYPFTLHKGRFFCFDSTFGDKKIVLWRNRKIILRDGEEPSPVRFLRNFEERRVILLEIDSEYEEEVCEILIIPLIVEALKKRTAVLFSSHRLVLEDIRNLFKPYGVPDEYYDRVRVIKPKRESVETRISWTFFETVLKNVDELKSITGGLTVVVMSFNCLAEILGDEGARRVFLEVVNMIRDTNNVLLTTLATGTEHSEEIKRLADVIVKVMVKYGRMFVMGEQPYTPLYGVNLSEKEDHVVIELKRIS